MLLHITQVDPHTLYLCEGHECGEYADWLIDMNPLTKEWCAMQRRDPLNNFHSQSLNHILEIIKRTVSFQEHEVVELIYH